MADSTSIQEMQILEQNLQNLLMQKQSFQMESNEIANALSELTSATGDVFRVLGGVMLKANKESLTSELTEKKRIIDLRISTIEKQEALFVKKANELRTDIKKDLETKKN